ncbi:MULTISPECIES: Eco47II family restriction endonuclease [unclassified Thermosynechococcus]|uniref:Eco47II family restriction endonuclease n=1 Tax=unclassified Thermosynechococcus TaxID=2622553 RepID=UPI002873953B|nr:MULTISPECIES: Eco47II family restriction endonuclease [unclassified Thermosynechococcus]WNC33763.1 Eco47II family restriction endonuclease [Thermosynechococcus sp. PKX95]WNC36291.1 Eco47II family restriction endonuclease [Thermosynechococcus sp. PKX91]WNC38810.1 Eco47II family restriction endonuclease [Thermosynechococcus sp. WL11]WNC41331.1 Eco47II family restriction endonuclease [Thermosynechococcus sp. WL17]WNC43850.1 Eco47II family restriction endonuclease [Thermosynechococcus sp. WL15]
MGFISDEDIRAHVKETILNYRSSIDFTEFKKLKIDPIKATFDIAVYHLSDEEFIEREIIRQIDKSNNNHIGYFHQNIFRYIQDWEVLESGYDIVNRKKSYYAEIKNKFNTMNSNAKENIFRKMQQTIDSDSKAICFLIEVISKESKNLPWSVKIDDKVVKNERIRIISIDKFYEIATGDKDAFAKLCKHLPQIIQDVIESEGVEIGFSSESKNIRESLRKVHPNLLAALYYLAFSNYEGFKDFTQNQ